MICASCCYELTDSQMYSTECLGQILEKILTDQGWNFESDLLKALCEIAQIKNIKTSGYHPQTNGQCECFNATLMNMLGTLPEKPESTWREQVPTLVHAYNCTRNNATSFSPYYLMFGQKHICLLIWSLGPILLI